MGQTISIQRTVRLGDVALFDTDRTLGGQDGETFASLAEAEAGTTYPARLATRLFGVDDRLEKVFVASNTVSAQRRGGWDDQSAEAAIQVMTGFFRFY